MAYLNQIQYHVLLCRECNYNIHCYTLERIVRNEYDDYSSSGQYDWDDWNDYDYSEPEYKNDDYSFWDDYPEPESDDFDDFEPEQNCLDSSQFFLSQSKASRHSQPKAAKDKVKYHVKKLKRELPKQSPTLTKRRAAFYGQAYWAEQQFFRHPSK